MTVHKMQAMTRLTLILGLFFVWACAAMAERPRPLGWAIDAARSGNWENAARIASRDGPVAEDIIEWMRLRTGRGTYPEVQAFLERRPDWPGERYLRRQAESEVARYGPDDILAFFEDTSPQTPRGVLAYAGALSASSRSGDAQVALVVAWRTMQMSDTTQAMFLDRHAALLAIHHEARLEEMLWRGSGADARRMFDLVGDDWVKLAEARLGLLNRAGNVDALIAAVPESLQDHPLLAHARFEWRVRKGSWETAKAMILEHSRSFDKLGHPDFWSNRRRSLARDEMRDGVPERAYQIAARHFLTSGSDYADLEWLSGYIALQYLGEPGVALAHFQNHRKAVASPISRGRAGYWIGRAYEALDETDLATEAYADGAQFQTSFYGLLAAERAGLPPDPDLAGNEPFGDWRTSEMAERDVFQAGLLLRASDEKTMAERFWTHLVEGLDTREGGQLGQAVIDLGEPHIAVMVGKRAARQGMTLHAPYYPLHPLAEADLPMAREMSLAIARRESEFDPVVQSGAGARGLMQIMPATGRSVARQLGIRDHATERLTSDAVYNARLGTHYLSTLAGRFNGNVVMVSAGYNAGPGRPIDWIDRFGDPREGREEDIVDWIEHVPFRETRNYIMRVTESLPIYRARLGEDPLPVPFSEELRGSTLLPFAPKGE